jgi:hypothetical protein
VLRDLQNVVHCQLQRKAILFSHGTGLHEVLAWLEKHGVSEFPAIVQAAVETAQEVEWYPKEVAIPKDTPILWKIVARLITRGECGG